MEHVIQLTAINRLTSCMHHYLGTIAITDVALSCMFMYSCPLSVEHLNPEQLHCQNIKEFPKYVEYVTV